MVKSSQTHRKKAQMTAIMVLGMHRSGTSALAGALESMGAYIGKANPDVKEQGTLVSINENLLSKAGCSWDNPSNINFFPVHEIRRAKLFVAELLAHNSYILLKDPRLVITYETWLKSEIIKDIRTVATYRNPMGVAKSLQKRNPAKWGIESGVNLWCIYNERLIRLIKKNHLPVISFDLPLESYLAKLDRILHKLNIELPHQQSYINTDRINWRFDADVLNDFPKAASIYKELQYLSSSNE